MYLTTFQLYLTFWLLKQDKKKFERTYTISKYENINEGEESVRRFVDLFKNIYTKEFSIASDEKVILTFILINLRS